MSKIKTIYILSFLFSLHIALSSYVNSSFLIKFVNEKYVGLIYVLASLLTIFLLSKSINILKKLGNRKLVLILLLINMLALVGLITMLNPYVVILSFISFLATNTLVLLCIDIFIEHFSDLSKIGKARGFYLTIVNLAWMLSPLVSALLIEREGGYIAIYILAFVTVIIMTIGLFFSVKTFEDRVYEKTPFLETYKYLKNNRHILAITVINFILQFFYAWMIVYTPIYLNEHVGLAWGQIGIIFTIMLSPFVIISLPLGLLIDKYHIKKRLLLFIGFAIICIFTLFIPFINSLNILLWAFILFMTRVGASIIETTSEVYLFSHIREEEAYLLSVFRDMNPVAFVIAPLIATIIFVFLPFKSIFIILGIIILAGFYYIPHLKHNHINEIILPNQNK